MGLFRIILLLLLSIYASAQDGQGLISCLQQKGTTYLTTSNSSSQYDSQLQFSLQNLRYTEPGVRKPYVLILPQKRQQVVHSVRCCIKHGWQIVVRSGGHSYEGLSSTSVAPNFAIIDLMNFGAVMVDMKSKTAWAEAGATLGHLYYAIALNTPDYGFPAGVCPTVGTGGHFSGGGMSMLSRKYGLAADNIIDALLVDANGKLLDRKSMGEDLFWALRGGGGGSWGVVVAWKVRLVRVPRKVTVLRVYRTGRNQVTDLVYRWQSIAPLVERDLFVRAIISGTQLQGGQKDVKLTFDGMYLGPLDQLLKVANESFPEMGIVAGDCEEMSWIDSISYSGYTTTNHLVSRNNSNKSYFKAKSDFVTSPISSSGLEGAWKFLEEDLSGYVIFSPLGGRMYEIPSSEIPFPHRAGYLYDVQYQVTWKDSSQDSAYIDWIRRFYRYMTPHVSKSPRGAYVNYIDLDLGIAVNGSSIVEDARAWGDKYFRGNFDRLVKIKTNFDPKNVFRNSQSIPVNK
ncbi:berberine bridge enzyme-like D-2 [Cryptomeria japonica]|uniref:berberine bridge enzyme-like D-2 n=1 Tax=Cryptomeria japonica TaxID=3369 RepID=UPI0027DA83EE|nr:berberine bridge enzyme-like D-2 [Cryptomeria japonica]